MGKITNQKIVSTRKELLISQGKLEKLSRVPRYKISEVENGLAEFTGKEIKRLWRALAEYRQEQLQRLQSSPCKSEVKNG